MPSLESPETEPQHEALDRQPLVGRFVHLAVVVGTIAGCGLLGVSTVSGFAAYVLAAGGVLIAAVLWCGTSAERDPERYQFARITLPGPMRLVLELGLVIASGTGIWIVWNRAAGETFLTVAALDFAVRYQRIAALLRSR